MTDETRNLIFAGCMVTIVIVYLRSMNRLMKDSVESDNAFTELRNKISERLEDQ